MESTSHLWFLVELLYMHHFLAGASNEPNINNDNKPLKSRRWNRLPVIKTRDLLPLWLRWNDHDYSNYRNAKRCLFWKARAEVVCLVAAGLAAWGWAEAERRVRAQIKQRSDAETPRSPQLSGFTSSSSVRISSSPPWIVLGLEPSSPPDKLRTYPRVIGNVRLQSVRSAPWIYTCLDGNHVTAAGDHGTEQVRLSDGRKQQKGTTDAAV